MDTIKSLFAPKKVKMSDIASPQPSKAATKAVDSAMKRAYKDQVRVRQSASALRTH